jgi:AraC-like DNA-binding protein
MHGDPDHGWHLEELAKATAMSRTTFVSYFKTVSGLAPLTYLTQWRMRLAERALREENTPVSVLAQSLGYASESAFSNAFKRVTGHSPRRNRSSVRASSSAGDGGVNGGGPQAEVIRTMCFPAEESDVTTLDSVLSKT